MQEIPFGEQYNQALQEISDLVVTAGAHPDKPNGNSINQIRTNEFLNFPWQLREFVLDTSGQLVMTTTKQTPAERFREQQTDIDRVIQFINENEGLLLWENEISGQADPRHTVPTDMLSVSNDEIPTQWGTGAVMAAIVVRRVPALLISNRALMRR